MKRALFPLTAFAQRDVQMGDGVSGNRLVRDSPGLPRRPHAPGCASLHRLHRGDVLHHDSFFVLLRAAKEAGLAVRQTTFRRLGQDVRVRQKRRAEVNIEWAKWLGFTTRML